MSGCTVARMSDEHPPTSNDHQVGLVEGRPLHEVLDWTPEFMCVPTALAAVTGRPVREVRDVLDTEVRLHGAAPTQDGSYNWKHWRTALTALGLWADVIEADVNQPISIEQFMVADRENSLLLVQVAREGYPEHVFAVKGLEYVDCNNAGRKLTFDGVLPQLEGFTVKRVLRIRNADPIGTLF